MKEKMTPGLWSIKMNRRPKMQQINRCSLGAATEHYSAKKKQECVNNKVNERQELHKLPELCLEVEAGALGLVRKTAEQTFQSAGPKLSYTSRGPSSYYPRVSTTGGEHSQASFDVSSSQRSRARQANVFSPWAPATSIISQPARAPVLLTSA